MLEGLDAFCQSMNADLFGHSDDGRDDAAGLVGKAGQKFQVNLESMKIEILEGVEGAVFGTEIVHPYFETVILQAVHAFLRCVRVGSQERFRNFGVNVNAGDIEFFRESFKVSDDVAAFEIKLGQV